jgi:hypothetical protein
MVLLQLLAIMLQLKLLFNAVHTCKQECLTSKQIMHQCMLLKQFMMCTLRYYVSSCRLAATCLIHQSAA